MAPQSRFRVKVCLPHGPDAHYFHAASLSEAEDMRVTLRSELPTEISAQIYIYVDTSLGHIRVS